MIRTVTMVAHGTVALGLTLVLAACSPGGGATPDAAPGPTEVEVSGSSSGSHWEEVTDPELRLRGCLVGTWTLDRDAWAASIVSVLEDSGYAQVSVEDSGEIIVVLNADETYTTTGEESLTVADGEGPDGSIRWQLRFDGTESGTWSAAADELTLTTGNGGRLAGEHELSIDGQALPTDMLPVTGSPWSDAMTTTCDADRMVANPANDRDAADVVFRRAG